MVQLKGSQRFVAEELLAQIAAALQRPVAVSAARGAIMRLAGAPESAFEVKKGGERLRLLPRWQVTAELVATLNRARPTVAIILSGAKCQGTRATDSGFEV